MQGSVAPESWQVDAMAFRARLAEETRVNRILARAARCVTDDEKAALAWEAQQTGADLADLVHDFSARRVAEILAPRPGTVDTTAALTSAVAILGAVQALPIGRDLRTRLAALVDAHIAIVSGHAH